MYSEYIQNNMTAKKKLLLHLIILENYKYIQTERAIIIYFVVSNKAYETNWT